jgi:hypothetical protein
MAGTVTPIVKNDGAVQYGTRILSIGVENAGTITTPVTYVAENFSVNRPTKVIERTDELDKPNGQVIYETFVTGSATLQLASATTLEPRNGMGFKVTGLIKDDTGTTDADEVFLISDVGRVEGQGAERKVNITFRKKIN